MKKLMSIALLVSGMIASTSLKAQDEDKSKRPSPPVMVTQKIASGATISIDYSQPSVKGRTLGKDLEPMQGKVWRTGANEATVFTTDKDLMIDGKKLPAGKYSMFTIFNGEDATVIFNKTWKQWGAFKYNEADDALRVKASVEPAATPAEQMTFTISPAGKIDLMWSDKTMDFAVE
ncbi:MAG: DUF2911 domain-containing protein [Ginsengibacter sp.]